MILYSLLFFLGILIGGVGVYFGSQGFRQRKKEQLILRQELQALLQARSELERNSAHNLALLEEMVHKYRHAHQELIAVHELECYGDPPFILHNTKRRLLSKYCKQNNKQPVVGSDQRIDGKSEISL